MLSMLYQTIVFDTLPSITKGLSMFTHQQRATVDHKEMTEHFAQVFDIAKSGFISQKLSEKTAGSDRQCKQYLEAQLNIHLLNLKAMQAAYPILGFDEKLVCRRTIESLEKTISAWLAVK